MKNYYKIKNVDCSVCASKIEKAILKNKNIKKCSINILTNKIYIETDCEEKTMLKDINEVAKKIIKEVEIG